MTIDRILGQVREAATVRTVFGDPIERDGVTVIPVAKVMGGGGGGEGGYEGEAATDPAARPQGSGGGFGYRAVPSGAYVLRDGKLDWRPAFDLNRAILVGQIVAIVFLLVLRSVVKTVVNR
jgi:uncharacterized spore protein YtfJ